VKHLSTPAAALLLSLAAAGLGQTPPPQQPAPGPLARNVIVLDAAHGGVDSGSRIGDSTLEKDVTLALAFRLRSLLAARGFTVVMTRENDAALRPGTPNGTALTLDDRAGIANHTRAAACLLLHATGAGQGVHLYSSELDALPAEPAVLPWLTAQAAWVAQSARLESSLGAALQRAKLPLVTSRASVRPVDSLTCPAVVVELAPEGEDRASVNGSDYQQRVAEALAGALVFWSRQVQPPLRLPTERTATAATDAPTGAQP
jgi:N-acetylmuramoyl-L-alanine amidase